MPEEYPKEVAFKDGFRCVLRPMVSDDQEALYRFFVSLPEEDRRYLRDDPTDRKLVEKWSRELNYDKVFPILAEHEGNILANATLHRQTFGWGKHVGEIRITIREPIPPTGPLDATDSSNQCRRPGKSNQKTSPTWQPEEAAAAMLRSTASAASAGSTSETFLPRTSSGGRY